jgi:hypothetical protein
VKRRGWEPSSSIHYVHGDIAEKNF